MQIVGVATSAAHLEISVPAAVSHDIGSSGNFTPRIMQAVADVDFAIEAKFESGLSQPVQGQGLIAEQGPGDLVRLDLYSDGTALRLFAAPIVGGVQTVRSNQVVSAGLPMYLRLERQGDLWTGSYLEDGNTWIPAVNFSHTMTLSSVGVFALNHGSPPSASPAHTMVCDYFFNAESPIVPEDGFVSGSPCLLYTSPSPRD